MTGGISSGKSTVARLLEELGAAVIDGDEIAHRLMEPHQPTWEDIVAYFGPEILNPDMTIDRIKLGSIVFDDPHQMQVLNRISRSRIIEKIKAEMQQIEQEQPQGILVLNIPLLYEAHMDELCDQVWVVWVSRETQIQRLMERNWLSREEAVQRIDSQMDLDEKARRADVVIDNSGSIETTLALANKYYQAVLNEV